MGRPLRVGVVCRIYPPHPLVGGVSTYMRELACALAALEHEVHVITESRVRLRREGLGVLVHGRPPDPLPLLPDLPETDRQLRWAAAAAGEVAALGGSAALDVVESASWGFEAIAIRRDGSVPTVTRLVSPLTVIQASERWSASPDLAASMALERWLIAHADGVIGSTAAIATTVRETMGIDPVHAHRYARIPLGISPGPPPPPKAARLPPRLLFVGRLERRKGIHTLLAALPNLLDRHPALEVDLVGADVGSAPTVRERFLAEHRRPSWRRRICFHGTVTERALDGFYARATALVAPSLFESFGLIYLEAMRHGTPVIGCRAGGIPEVVRDEETGLLVPAEEPAALAAAVDRLLGDAALRARLGAAGRRAVETEFSARRMAERTAEFYRAVLARAACTPGLPVG